MRSHLKATALSLCIAAAIGVASSKPAHAANPADSAPVTVSDLIYTPEEMFGFDIERYLAKHAPHLRGQSEAISHWAGYSSISPKVLIALMEQQSGIVTRNRIRGNAMTRPFGKLSRRNGFSQQVEDVAEQLRVIVYSQRDAEILAKAQGKVAVAHNPLRTLYQNTGESASSAALLGQAQFAATYGALFNETWGAKAKPSLIDSDVVALAGPASGFLRLPYPVGASWHVGGAHTNTGSGSYPMSSLDMSLGGGWGSNQSGVRVSSSASGTFKRHSSCFAEIVHSGGWSTTYYHMMNLQYATNAVVGQSVFIGNPANTQAQALCNGGSSTGPHQHWSLKLNGSHYHLNQVTLSGYLITATGTSYDTNCSRFYLVKGGLKYCSSYIVNNP
jgi:LasA protease